MYCTHQGEKNIQNLLSYSEARTPSLPSFHGEKVIFSSSSCCKLKGTCLKPTCSAKNRFKKLLSHLCVTKPKQLELGLHTCLKVCHAKETLSKEITFGWIHARQSQRTFCAATDFAEWVEAPHVPHCPDTRVAGCHCCLQHPQHSVGFLTPKRGIVHSSNPKLQLGTPKPF